MRDNDAPGGSADEPEWGTRELELLHHAVEDELSYYNLIGDFGIRDEAIQTLAWIGSPPGVRFFGRNWVSGTRGATNACKRVRLRRMSPTPSPGSIRML